MVQISKLLTVAAACLAAPVVAHPGEKHDPHVVRREIHAREALAAAAQRSLGRCENSSHARELNRRSIARRAHTLHQLRQKREIITSELPHGLICTTCAYSVPGPQKWRRNLAALEKWEAVDHNKTGILDYSANTPESMIFSANTSCILTPTVTDGPYYVWGEVVRSNVKEELYSSGVDLYLEVQYIDINTCRPVPGALVDIWQANATGVYRYVSLCIVSGFISSGLVC